MVGTAEDSLTDVPVCVPCKLEIDQDSPLKERSSGRETLTECGFSQRYDDPTKGLKLWNEVFGPALESGAALTVNYSVSEPEQEVPVKGKEATSEAAAGGAVKLKAGQHNWPEEQLSTGELEREYAERLFESKDSEWMHAMGEKENVHIFTEQDFPHQIPGVDDPVVKIKLEHLKRALADLKLIKEKKFSQEFLEDKEGFLAEVLDLLPSDEAKDFRAGGWTQSFKVWEEMLKGSKGKRPAVDWLLKVIEKGVQWETVVPLTQKGMPKFEQKLNRAVRALGKQVGQDEAWKRMHQKEPEFCHLPNHPSSTEFEKELTEKFEEYRLQGVIQEVPGGKRALVGCSLGAVFQNNKVRPIIDPVITNMHLKYEGVRYEQLEDVTNYAKKGDWATTTDEKSGYHHMALHPSMWNLLGFSWKGKNYVFTHVPFGVGPACRAYTVAKQELYRVVREMGGINLTAFIDDMMAVADSEDMALFQLVTILRLMFALGFTVSKKKLQLPAQRVQFLGLLTDLLNQKFWIPDEKIVAFQELVQELSEQETVCDRQLARVAGKLASYRLAVGMAPLYAQLLFKAYKGEGSWDLLYENPEQAVSDMKWAADHLREWNGKSWLQSRQEVIMAGDYGSNTGFGAFFPKGEMSEIEHSLTAAQVQEIQEHKLSSTKGELLALLYALQTVMHTNPAVLKGKLLHYQSDNQGTVAVINGMRGCATLLPTVREIWDLAWEADVDLKLSWFPRETDNQQVADHLSKLTDNSSWSLSAELFQVLATDKLVVSAGGFTVDVFADHDNCKVQWKGADRFYSRMWCKGTAAVDGFLQPWGFNSDLGLQEFCYIYGEFGEMGRILNKIIKEKANCVLLYPVWPRYWKSMLQEIPVKKVINLSRMAARRGWRAITAGPRVDTSKGSKDRPSWKLEAAFIVWDQKVMGLGSVSTCQT